jgi:molecular chaperone GrpE
VTAPEAGHEHDEVTAEPGAGSGAGAAAGATQPAGADPGADGDEPTPTIVVRDRRRVDAAGTGPHAAPAAPAAAEPAAQTNAPAEAAGDETDETEPAAGSGTDDTSEQEAGVTPGDTIDLDVASAEDAEGGKVDGQAADGEVGVELGALRRDIGELTRDLQRITAEYANYRKRVDRDRTLVSDQAIGNVLGALIPVLDDLDRARAHGDLVGPFAAVADQLLAAVGKFGLTAFGETGDPFDPTLHEAVSHTSSPDVTQTTCIEIMRRGYQLGDRLLRPALVAVADPE